MTTGQLMFYAGVGLLALTAIFAVVFAMKKPKYIPENAAYIGGDTGTQKLRSGYPTDRLTIRRESEPAVTPGTVPLNDGTKPMVRTSAEVLPTSDGQRETAKLNAQATEKLDAGTAALSPETEPLYAAENETASLDVTAEMETGETGILEQDKAGGTEKLGETVLLS